MNAYNVALLSQIEKRLFAQKQECCVFISHKKEDERAAIEIGDYLLNTVGVNIYLDTRDITLQEATRQENDRAIVNSIKCGLSHSTHILCIISDKTNLSWWVPYEIGIADSKELNIASLKLKCIDDVPSFLKINPVLHSLDDFIKYASTLGKYGTFFFEKKYKDLSSSDKSQLLPFLE